MYSNGGSKHALQCFFLFFRCCFFFLSFRAEASFGWPPDPDLRDGALGLIIIIMVVVANGRCQAFSKPCYMRKISSILISLDLTLLTMVIIEVKVVHRWMLSADDEVVWILIGVMLMFPSVVAQILTNLSSIVLIVSLSTMMLFMWRKLLSYFLVSLFI